MNITELVKGNSVYFDSFRQGIFYYILNCYNGAELQEYGIRQKFSFPVPIEDIGTATMLKEDKAITFMRWIRKAIEDKTLIEVK